MEITFKKKRQKQPIKYVQDWATRASLKTGDELRNSERARRSCSANDSHHVVLLKLQNRWMNEEIPGSAYKWNISIVICDTDIP